MSSVVLENENATAITQTSVRLEAVLQEARKDEALLKRILETRRLKRRLKAAQTKRSS